MRIEFTSLKWKNFLSYGNKWTSVDFPVGFRAIKGSNGAGKSTIIDALFYGLFGKTYRDVNLDELINRTNGSDMLVEVSFKRGEDLYTILRGRSPNILSVTKNGNPVELLSSKSQTQTEIDGILGIKQELFRRVAISSIALTKPFMTMAAQEQRDFLSDVFNLGVFTKMSSDVKKRTSELKVEYRVAEGNERTLRGAYESAERILNNIKTTNEELRTKKADNQHEVEEKIRESNEKISSLTHKAEELKTKVSALENEIPESNQDEISKVRETLATLKSDAQRILNDIGFFEKNETCPVCGQVICEEFRKSKLESLNAKKDEIAAEGMGNQSTLKKLMDDAEERRDKISKRDAAASESRECGYDLSSEKRNLEMYGEQLKKISESVEVDPAGYEEELANAKTNWENSKGKLDEVTGELSIQKSLSEILSDGGVRKYYIEKYVGVVDSLVNGHLAEFGLPLEFSFGGSLEAKLKSRNEEISYMSCSEGEKKRIDVAILLAFMEVTKVLSNWDCNLVFFDELFDSSVDEENLNAIIKAVREIVKRNGQCSYIITHRNSQTMDFDGFLSVTKQSRFSALEVSSNER